MSRTRNDVTSRTNVQGFLELMLANLLSSQRLKVINIFPLMLESEERDASARTSETGNDVTIQIIDLILHSVVRRNFFSIWLLLFKRYSTEKVRFWGI